MVVRVFRATRELGRREWAVRRAIGDRRARWALLDGEGVHNRSPATVGAAVRHRLRDRKRGRGGRVLRLLLVMSMMVMRRCVVRRARD